MTSARVVVVVPNRDGKHHLQYSMPLLAGTAYSKYETVVVDNCSSDGSVEFLATRYPQIHLLKNEINRGFAGGVNIGIRWAMEREADYIAIFSNDIKVLPDWLNVACGVLRQNPQAGILGFTELARDEESKLAMPKTIEWISVGTRLPGFLYLCDSKIFQSVGLFDEEYFMYGEESDLFARVLRGGYQILQTNIPVWHYAGGFTSKAPFKVAWLAYRNGIRFSIKNDSPARILVQSIALLYYGAFCNSKLAAIHSKLRPSMRLVNGCIWAGALFWNLLNLVKTLQARRRDSARIRLRV